MQKGKPPKKWISQTVKELRIDSDIKQPAALAAWLWSRGLSEKDRKKFSDKREKQKTERGQGMKRTKKRARKMSGEVAYYGGRKSRRKRRMSGEVAYYGGRRKSRRMSGSSRGRKMDLIKPLMNTALAVGGGVAGRLVKNAIPINDARIKAAIPVLLGIVISMMSKTNKMLENIGFGMAAIGGAELAAALMPDIALFQGEQPAQVAYTAQDIQEALSQGLISQDEANVLSQAGGYMGMIEDFSGQDDSIEPDIQEYGPDAANASWETTENVM